MGLVKRMFPKCVVCIPTRPPFTYVENSDTNSFALRSSRSPWQHFPPHFIVLSTRSGRAIDACIASCLSFAAMPSTASLDTLITAEVWLAIKGLRGAEEKEMMQTSMRKAALTRKKLILKWSGQSGLGLGDLRRS